MERSFDIAIPLYQPTPSHLRALAAGLMGASRRLASVTLTDDSGESNAAMVADTFGGLATSSVTVTYEHNSQRLGMVGNWNKAVKAGVAAYVVNLGQDDVLEAHALNYVADRLDALPYEPPFVAIGRGLIDGAGRPLKVPRRVHEREYIFRDVGDYTVDYELGRRLALRNGQVLGEPCSIFLNRQALRAVDYYDRRLEHVADLDVLLRLLLSSSAPALLTNRVRALRRIHRDNLTHSNVLSGTAGSERHWLFRQYVLGAAERDVRKFRAYLLAHDLFDAVRVLRRDAVPGELKRVLERARSDQRLSTVIPLCAWAVCQVLGVNPDRRLARAQRAA